MKTSINLYSINILVLLFLILSSVPFQQTDSNKNLKYKPGEYTLEDLKVHDTKTNKIISIGMSKTEVTNLLGQEKEINFRKIYYYDGLKVYYRDDKVAGLMVLAGDNIDNRYQTYRGVGLTSTMQDVMDRYGETKVEELFGSYSATYQGKLDGTILKTNSNNDPLWLLTNQERIYVISFGFFNNSNKSVSGIYISDHTFAYSGK
ncbi:hypothetical protein [Paenibacillus sp. Soil787]|uniref:hypothetical protein n=1 Tax=Paenibacillus sp. Soil787 TaxID=1736411 RepID=UPI000702FE47|nr:hypothetical protein [Paenibacillus sp. Soil787]KRF22535.1 hypothetical protein ASG93_29920 [Paenibacillus sp. Soil787]